MAKTKATSKLADETTGNQSKKAQSNLSISSISSLPGLGNGFNHEENPDYDLFRKISAHPTVAQVMSIVYAPIIGNNWVYEKQDGVPEERVEFIQAMLEPKRPFIVKNALRAMELGWQPFELIWENSKDATELKHIKPLLQDITNPVVDAHGNLQGVINKSKLGETILTDDKYFVFTFDAQDGSPLGRSRHLNIAKEWQEADQVRKRLAMYLTKITGVIAQVHYPEGTLKDFSGADRPTSWLAQQILDGIAAGKSVMLPNLLASMDNPREAAETAGKSAWVIDFLDPGGVDYSGGIKAVLEYYDQLLFMGWLRSPRVGLEAKTSGSRADSESHSDTGILDCEQIDADLCYCISKHMINKILTLNFGEEAQDTVWISPAPLSDASIGNNQSVLSQLLQDKDSETIRRIDIEALLDILSVPQLEEEDVPEASMTINEPEQSTETVVKPKKKVSKKKK